jgi:hypothetical protein
MPVYRDPGQVLNTLTHHDWHVRQVISGTTRAILSYYGGTVTQAGMPVYYMSAGVRTQPEAASGTTSMYPPSPGDRDPGQRAGPGSIPSSSSLSSSSDTVTVTITAG